MSQTMTIARPYAEAAFDYAQSQGQVAAWATFLDKLSQIVKHPEIQSLYHSPKINREDLVGVIATLAKVEEKSPQANFVRLLMENKRLSAGPEIEKRFVLLQHQSQDILDVEMVSAVAVDDSQKAGYINKLSAVLGRNIVLHCKKQEDILGGFIIRYGDKVIDASIKGQLNKLAACLLD
jgi:F-type H+-transporting ATPase subunit delta